MQYNPNNTFSPYGNPYSPPPMQKQPWDRKKQWIVTICAITMAILLLWDSCEVILFLNRKPVLISVGHSQAFPIERVVTQAPLPTATPTIPFIPPIPTRIFLPKLVPILVPTRVPTMTPTSLPTAKPTQTPTRVPIATPTPVVTVTPTPTLTSTPMATATATAESTPEPTVAPTASS